MTDPFRIRAHVADFEAISAHYTALSEKTRARWTHRPDLAYGSHPDERLDLVLPEATGGLAPIHIFVHGGYWRANRKEDYAFIAAPVVEAGGIAAILDYSLMPGGRMAQLVDQVRRAAIWVGLHAAEFGGDATRISASGHSAGAHLAFYLGARGAFETDFPAMHVRALLLVSGIYDLAPISGSFLQAEIGLTGEEVAAWSPMGAQMGPGIALTVTVGENETPPFLSQAAAFAAHNGVRVKTLPGLNHMTIVQQLGTPGSAAAKMLTGVAVG